MATQIVISNGDYIKVDDLNIQWVDKGTVMPELPNTVHYVIWNSLVGPNEIQHKDASTGDMTGNSSLSSTSDDVGSTTIGDLLTWGETRKGQIETAEASHDAVHQDDIANNTTNARGKTWRDYDPHYS